MKTTILMPDPRRIKHCGWCKIDKRWPEFSRWYKFKKRWKPFPFCKECMARYRRERRTTKGNKDYKQVLKAKSRYRAECRAKKAKIAA